MKLGLSFANTSALFLFLVVLVGGWSTSVCADCELAKLLASDGTVSDKLGTSVAVFGDTTVIGAYNDDDNGSNSGSVYVFRFDGSDWIQEEKLTASDGAANDYFGYSVGIFGDTIAVGAPKEDEVGSQSGSVYIFRFDGTGWVQEQKLTASDGALSDEFGTAVGIFGDTVVVGSPYDDDNGSASGSAYVFRFDGSTWVQDVKLIASDGALGDDFGRAVGMFGDVAVVGSPNDDTNGGDSGSAHVFRFNGSNWTQETKLLAADGAWADSFGTSVAVCGDTAVIGAYLDDDNGSSSGSAYVFRFDGMHWNQENKLLAPDGVAGDYFAKSVAVWGDVVVIGTDGDDDHGENSGSGYVFRYTGSSWVHETKLLASDGAAGDYFGGAVAISGDTVVIGATDDDDNGAGSGSGYIFGLEGATWEEKLLASDGMAFDYFGWCVAISGNTAIIGTYSSYQISSAYVFRSDGSSWVEEAKLLAPDATEEEHMFGSSVAVSGDTAVIGAFGDTVYGSNSGAVYVFRFDGSNWNMEQKLTASDGDSGDTFGKSVAVSGDTAVIGAYGNDDLGNISGSAYVFRFNGLSWVEQAKLLAFDGSADDHFGCSVSISGDTAVIGAQHYNDYGWNFGSAYVFRFDGSNWNQEAKLIASDGAEDDWFGDSVAISGDTAVIGAPHDDDNGVDSGSAYVFRFDGSNWNQEQKLTTSDGGEDDWFGNSVSVSGDTAVIGAHGDDGNRLDSGSAYVFHCDGSSWNQDRKLLPSDGAEILGRSFGFSVAVSGDTTVIGSPDDYDNGKTTGSASIFGLALNPGDLDLDNDVDFHDFCLLAEFWLENDCGPCRCDRADFNRDGKCDGNDLMELAANWLRGK